MAARRTQHPYRTGTARMPSVFERQVAYAAMGRQLRDLRLERGIRQTELARAAGVHESTVVRIERGTNGRPGRRKSGFSIDILIRLALALGVQPRELWP